MDCFHTSMSHQSFRAKPAAQFAQTHIWFCYIECTALLCTKSPAPSQSWEGAVAALQREDDIIKMRTRAACWTLERLAKAKWGVDQHLAPRRGALTHRWFLILCVTKPWSTTCDAHHDRYHHALHESNNSPIDFQGSNTPYCTIKWAWIHSRTTSTT